MKILHIAFLSFLLNGHLSANTIKNADTLVTCSQPVTIWLENFTYPDGTTSGSVATPWSVTNTSPSKNSVFAVYNNEFRANNITINGLGTWASGIIDITGKTNVNISVDIRSAGGLTADSTTHTDYLSLYYKIDGGAEVLFSDNKGKINNNATVNTTVSIGSLSGRTLQIIIRAKATATSEFYYFDNIKVSGLTSIDATATAGGMLSCAHSSVVLNGNSSVSNVAYAWTGPDGFTSSSRVTAVTAAGVYMLTVTDTSGCAASSTVTITQDTVKPAGVATISDPANGLLTCSNTNVVLIGSSSTSGVTYSWTGPDGYTATGASTTVTAAGNYTVTVTNPNNGCNTSVTAAAVTQNITIPQAVSASVSDKLTCRTSSVTLTGGSTTPDVTYAWVGPDGFMSTSRVTPVTVGGVYTLTATDPSNGCSFSRQITVQADQVHPGGVTISSDGSLSCTVGSVTLTGGSTTPNVGYTWTGPNGFFDPGQITSVADSGTYVLTVNNPGNGCNTVASINVIADFTECSMAAPRMADGHAVALDAADGSAASVSGLIYKVYPNPARSTAFVELHVPASDHVSVEVYNGAGVREKILFDGNVEAGTPYRWTLDAGSLSAGVHYCMIRTKNKVYVSKLLTTR